MLPKAAAIDAAIANGVQRVHVISYKLPDSILLEVFTNEGTGTLVVNDINALTPAEQGEEIMSRLWEKGLPLDERVLRYTAGEDHLLDARLVPYDVRGSIAHAEMLAATGALSARGLRRDSRRPASAREELRRRRMADQLEDEDVHTALESRLTDNIGEAGGRLHLGRSRNDQVLTALRLYLRDAALDLAGRVDTCCRRSRTWRSGRATSSFPATRTCNMRCRLPSRCGAAASMKASPTPWRACMPHRRINKNPLGSAAGYGTPGCRSIAT